VRALLRRPHPREGLCESLDVMEEEERVERWRREAEEG
jgi:hypothetical protein